MSLRSLILRPSPCKLMSNSLGKSTAREKRRHKIKKLFKGGLSLFSEYSYVQNKDKVWGQGLISCNCLKDEHSIGLKVIRNGSSRTCGTSFGTVGSRIEAPSRITFCSS